MAEHLIVVAPHGDRKVGDRIVDPVAIATALAERPGDVVRVNVPDAPALSQAGA